MWTNEEGSRFPPAMVSSGVFAGAFDLEYGLSRADLDGKTMGEELQRIGYAGNTQVGGRAFKAFFEAHIEQGPILENEQKQIGVVTDAQGQRWYEVTLTGQESHAGPTPMPSRRDALVGAARIVDLVNQIGMENQPNACATVGLMQVFPNSRNVIPGQVFFTVDFRHPDAQILAQMDKPCARERHVLSRTSNWIWTSSRSGIRPPCHSIRTASLPCAEPRRSSASVIARWSAVQAMTPAISPVWPPPP
ncbi:putative hydrolase [Halomonas elongata]|uniref:Putative hydrolase n=1 Tax=Halomonas elongata TaxID=2746 RepID=A0A1B8P7G3_HALEL|nr:putative hydrolase [Halomonas elongata]